ncbi:stage II sporulation protein M [Candidatus Pacearchaeota archaeon]|nr:stage II sporulation protein M [Candidatus Pacearchaeota archaeon]
MFEMLLSPKKAERRPWELFFVGAFYASISLLLVNWMFSADPVLSKYSGILIVTFTVMFSLPFVYFTIRYEEKKITKDKTIQRLLGEHKNAIFAFLWLFVGFVVAFSFWYIVLSSASSFQAQIETFCMINRPNNFNDCVTQYGIKKSGVINANVLSETDRFRAIFSNNLSVLMFTLIFSLIFGAGAIFVLAWNASVIAAAIGIFARSNISAMPCGLFRYLIHGIPEIAAYFIVALAGGIVSTAVIRHEWGTDKFWEVLEDSLSLVLVSIVVLLGAGLIEVWITPDLVPKICPR